MVGQNPTERLGRDSFEPALSFYRRLYVKQRRTHDRNKSIIEDYKNGKPILEIAREYNLSETMCYKILKGTQEPPRYFEKKRKRLTTRNEQIVKQYKGGMTARELGKMYGISMQRIYAILHSSGEYESQKYNHIETALKKEKKMRNQTFLDAYKKNPRKSIIELSQGGKYQSFTRLPYPSSKWDLPV